MIKTVDEKFIEQKDSLVEQLGELAEYLGDDDARKVDLEKPHGKRRVATESANTTDPIDDSASGERLA